MSPFIIYSEFYNILVKWLTTAISSVVETMTMELSNERLVSTAASLFLLAESVIYKYVLPVSQQDSHGNPIHLLSDTHYIQGLVNTTFHLSRDTWKLGRFKVAGLAVGTVDAGTLPSSLPCSHEL